MDACSSWITQIKGNPTTYSISLGLQFMSTKTGHKNTSMEKQLTNMRCSLKGKVYKSHKARETRRDIEHAKGMVIWF